MWKPSEIRFPALALLAIVIAIGLRPGDSSWFFDMSFDFDLALHYNATPSKFAGLSLPFTPAPFSMEGTHGIRYGPLPVWIDQVFLAFTHNLVVMTAIRAIAVAALTAFALLWLTQLTGVSPWLAVVTMLSPWLWYYSRQLWDNSLNIPITALLFAAYSQFLYSRRAWAICVAAVCAAAACLVHLMAIPFVAAIALHALIFETRSLKRVTLPLFGTVAALLLISIPYLHYLFTTHPSHLPDNVPTYEGFLFPLFGAQHLTAQHIGYLLEEDWTAIFPAPLKFFFTFACVLTCIAYLASWAGMLIALRKADRAIWRNSNAPTLEKLSLAALIALLAQILFDGFERASVYPHYYNASWIIYVLFAWIAFDAFPRRLGQNLFSARIAIPVYAASLLFVQIIVAWQIAKNSGMKGSHYNAVLSNQIEVARDLARFSPNSPINMQVNYWQAEPHTLRILRQIIAPAPAGPPRQLTVRFRDAFPGDARIIVENHPLPSQAAIAP